MIFSLYEKYEIYERCDKMFGFLFGNNIKSLSGQEAKEMIKKNKNIVLIDVRSSMEVASGKVKGAKNIDVSSNTFNSQVEKLDKNKTYILYCASGGRSHRACSIMKNMGFEEVYNVQGGIMSLM